MNEQDANIRINADPADPGQFFACCGLLELAERVAGSAEGCFSDRQFFVACSRSIDELLTALVDRPATEITTLANGLSVKPLISPLRLSLGGERECAMILDFWMSIKFEKGVPSAVANPPWNFWSGQQTSARIWRDLRTSFAGQLAELNGNRLDQLFSLRTLLSGRFGFDPGAAWTALDAGFSPNEQRIDVASSAAVELLAAVGVQRFRPNVSDDRQSFIYSTWGNFLSPSVACVAAAGAVCVLPSVRYRCRVISRGSYAALGRSVPA